MKEAEQIDLMMASIHMHKHSTLTFRKLVMMKTYAVMKKQHRLAEYIDELGLVIIPIKEAEKKQDRISGPVMVYSIIVLS